MKYKKKSHEPYQYSIELYALFAKKKCSFCLLPLYIPPKIYLWYILVQLRNCPIISYVEYLPNNSLYDFFFFFWGLNMRTQFKLLFSILFHLIIKIASYLYVEELPSGYEFKPHFHVLHPTEGVLINQTFLLVYAFRISVSLSNLYHQ